MNWYVIHTKPKWEKKVAFSLQKKGFEVYLPLQKTLRQWSDRKKKVEEPLFKSYVFIRVSDGHRESALFTPGVVRYLFWLGKPAVVLSREIEAIREFLGEVNRIESTKVEVLKAGQELEIQTGFFKGNRGRYLAMKGNKILLYIESLGRIMKAEVPVQHVLA